MHNPNVHTNVYEALSLTPFQAIFILVFTHNLILLQTINNFTTIICEDKNVKSSRQFIFEVLEVSFKNRKYDFFISLYIWLFELNET